MTGINRRQFIGALAASLASISFLPRHVLGGVGYRSPNEKLNIAGVGVGGMGGADVAAMASENIVALCDVDWKFAARTFEKYPQAKKYRDYRVMLEKQKDIDAVVIATPDHSHATVAMAAIRAGKHVYVEKPMSHTIHEVRTMTRAARETGVATQMGNQGHAEESMRLLREWITDGAIGTVRRVEAWTPHAVWPQGIDRPTETPPVPDELSWDLWNGPAPQRPYHPAYLAMKWRGWWDFGTGALGDMGCHILDPVFYALDLRHPTSVEASFSTYVPTVTWNKTLNTETYPRASIVRYRFPARGDHPPLELTWYDGGLMPERPEELEEGRRMGTQYGGVLFIGDQGKILGGSHGAGGLRIIPESKMQEYERPAKTLPRSIGHREEWIEACKNGTPTGSDFEYAGPLTETVLLGNISIRMGGKKLLWDPEAMKITNVAEANQYLHREYREGWTL